MWVSAPGPADLGVWDKLQLGWLDYAKRRPAGAARTVELGPHAYNSAKRQALIVELPPKRWPRLCRPRPGATGSGGVAPGTPRTPDSVPATGPSRPKRAQLTFAANYNIEDCGANPCDAAYVEVDDRQWPLGFQAIKGSITAGGTEHHRRAESRLGAGRPSTWAPSRVRRSTCVSATPPTPAYQGKDPAAPAGLLLDDIAITAGGQDDLRRRRARTARPVGQAVGFRNVGDLGQRQLRPLLPGQLPQLRLVRPVPADWTVQPRLAAHPTRRRPSSSRTRTGCW